MAALNEIAVALISGLAGLWVWLRHFKSAAQLEDRLFDDASAFELWRDIGRGPRAQTDPAPFDVSPRRLRRASRGRRIVFGLAGACVAAVIAADLSMEVAMVAYWVTASIALLLSEGLRCGAALYAAAEADFLFLQMETGLTKGNLAENSEEDVRSLRLGRLRYG